MSDELLTSAETADLLRSTEQTLANWRWSGKGPPFIKAGSKVLYRRSGVDAWLDAHTQNTAGHGVA